MSIRAVALLSILSVASAVRYADGVGRLPALGWNSWNAYHCDVDQEKLLTAANDIVNKGFKDAGYTYINCDDCWSNHNGRDNTTHQLLPNMTKFPDGGIKGVADKVHNMGLKFGIYSSAGTLTCGLYPASLGYELIDAATWASWGVDYLVKYDNCWFQPLWNDACYACQPDITSGQQYNNGSCTENSELYPLCKAGHKQWPVDGVNYTASYTALRYRVMQNALEMQNRTILYSLCEWGMNEVWTWGNETANSWRSTGDISPDWASITFILNMNSFLSEWSDFYGHNDADMLEVKNGNLTEAETRSHFAMWAVIKSPLIIGTDLSNISQTNIDILQNKYLLAFNQDPVHGKPAQPYNWDHSWNATHPAEYWSGSFVNGTLVAMLNTLNDTRSMTAEFSDVPQLSSKRSYKVTNAWTGEGLGCKHGKVTMKVEKHDTAVLILEDC